MTDHYEPQAWPLEVEATDAPERHPLRALVALVLLLAGLYVLGALLCAATDPQARPGYRASSEPWVEVTP